MQDFINRLEDILKARRIKKAELSRETQIADTTLRSYFQGVEPPVSAIIKIAAYLGISLDFLLCGDDEPAKSLSDEERELLNAFRRLDDRDKNAITTLAQSLLNQYSDSTKRTITVG